MVTPSRNRGVVALALTFILVGAGAIVTVPRTVALADDDDLAGAQARANQAARELADAENEIAKAERAVNTTKQRTTQIEAKVGSLRDQVGQLALRRYVEGTKPLSRLFSLVDANEVVRAQQFAQVVAGSANDSVRRYKAEREDLRDELAVLERQKEEQADAVSTLRKRKSAALAQVEQLTRIAREKQAQAARDAQRLRAQAAPTPAARGNASAAQPAPIVSGGAWLCPVAGPHAFSNDYGDARGGGRSHEGNDILASRGTPIVASVSGSVRHHNASLGGRSYYLDGNDGVTYFGTHMDAYGASGQVSAGTVVGYVGDDGDAKGTPHLHFEMHPGGGGPINPYPTLSKYC